MSILYQALSRAARENARRSTAGSAPDSGAAGTTPEPATGASARLRNFTTFSFRPRRNTSAGRGRLVLLGVVVAALAGGWLLISSLSSGPGGIADIAAEIPVVSDLAAMVGLEPEPIYYQPAGEQAVDPNAQPEVIADLDPPPSVADDVALANADDALMLTPPAAISENSGPNGGGIELGAGPPDDTATPDSVETTDTDSQVVADVTEEPAPVEALETLPPPEPVTVATDEGAPAPLLPEAAVETDSMHPTDAPPAEARETLEQTLQRLANERGFTDLAPPVEITRAGAADTATIDVPPADPNFSITVDDRTQVQQASFEAAYSSLLAGNTEGALNLYLDVLRDDPDNTFALFGLASTLQRIGWLAEARATYEELLAIEPENRGALANMMTLISQEAPEQALSNLTRLYEINPGFSPIPAQMAVLYAGRGDYDQAIRFLKAASDLSPENMMYVYNLAIIHDRLGDHDEARALYEKVLSAAEIRDVNIPLEAVRERVSYLKKL